MPMDPMLTARDAAALLGIGVTTFYAWLSQSDAGKFELRGQSITIDYYQGGRRGQGRIKLEPSEIDRLLKAMRVKPAPQPKRHVPSKPPDFPGITVPLGRPD
jgi:hypothetical protein